MLVIRVFLTLCFLSIPLPILAWEGRVIDVLNGDLISVFHDGKEERLKLYGVDTPDDPQEFGVEAREFTSSRVLGKTVEVIPVSQDNYGNILGVVVVKGLPLNRELAEAGLAWVYGRSCSLPECREWKDYESEAKRRGTGLWSNPSPIPPWEYRRTYGQTTSEGSRVKSELSEAAEKDKSIEYHGDVVKHIYHAPSCPEYKCRSCIADFKGKIAAERAGYKPCPVCNP